MVAVSLDRRRRAAYRLTSPRHVREFAQAVERAYAGTSALETSTVHVERTSQGVQVSASRIESEAGDIYHYALSGPATTSEEAIRALVGVICRRWHPAAWGEIVTGSQGVHHLLVRPVRRSEGRGIRSL
jgi:hypothetical protein